jgi:glycosyltransferase involved in cell wall biosynthesis
MTVENRPPLVSIIVNCFNGERFLRESLSSIFSQTYQNFEVIFWDNRSTDKSKEIAKSFDGRLKYFLAKDHSGLGKARVSALEKAMGDYICFLDTDDLLAKDRLSEQVAFMEFNRVSFSYGSHAVIDSTGTIRKTRILREGVSYQLKEQLTRYTICMPTVMIRKELFDLKWCFLDPSLVYSPDANLFLKILANYPAGVMTKVLSYYRIHDNQLSKKTFSHVGFEHKVTLDELMRLFPEVTNSLLPTFDWAYSKVNFYDAIGYIHDRDYVKAQLIIAPVTSKSVYYKILYLLIIFRVPAPMILWLLSR